jgi:hypothetical protein
LVALGCQRGGEQAPGARPPDQHPGAGFPGGAPGGFEGFPGAPGSQGFGVLINEEGAARGYTLLAPLTSHATTLIDSAGRTVHTWQSDCSPALGAALLENGNLLRACELPKTERPFELSGGGGRVQEFTWDGELVWDFRYFGDRRLPHHDALKLPNGNVLLIVCERVPLAEAVAAGRRPNTVAGDHLMSDCLVEIKPTGRTTGEVVWEWRVWDHLVQETDRTRPNYGSAADHPELIDLNFTGGSVAALSLPGPESAKLQALGYVGGPTAAGAQTGPRDGDWTHLNSVAYHPERDQIAVTGLGFSEVWVIDHSTTRAEAAGHTGGKAGMGGDLLYRWGNPRAFRRGTTADQRLVAPHSANWIGRGLPGAGHLLVFSNGTMRPDDRASTVEEIDPPVDATGRYARKEKSAFGPERAVWSYNSARKPDFFSPTFSGAQRLPNGNTLMCLGLPGTVLEVTREGSVVWKYLSPGPFSGREPKGPFPGGAPPGLSLELLPRDPLFRAPWYAPDYPGLAGRFGPPEPAP